MLVQADINTVLNSHSLTILNLSLQITSMTLDYVVKLCQRFVLLNPSIGQYILVFSVNTTIQ